MRVERQFKVKGGLRRTRDTCFIMQNAANKVPQVEVAGVERRSPVGLTWPGFQS